MTNKLNKENQDWLEDKYSQALGVYARHDVKQKLIEMQTQIEAAHQKIEKLETAIRESVKDRHEQYDYTHHVYCNFCDENLTKSKGRHGDDCIIKELTE